MEIVERKIREVMTKRKLKPIDVYEPLKINRVNFYKAIKTSNVQNRSLKKILDFLGYEINIDIKKNDKRSL